MLIIERDDLIAGVLADAIADEGLTTAVTYTEQEAAAVKDPPRVVVTCINREGEDLRGIAAARELCVRWGCAGILYLAALWPKRLMNNALTERERFLPKPVSISRLTDVIQELLNHSQRYQEPRGENNV